MMFYPHLGCTSHIVHCKYLQSLVVQRLIGYEARVLSPHLRSRISM